MALGRKNTFPSICAQANGAFLVYDLVKYINWYPDKLKRHGDVFRAMCPVHGETVFRTLVLNPRNNTCHCEHRSCPAHAPADFIELLARLHGKTMPEALADALDHFGAGYFKLNERQVETIRELAAEAAEDRAAQGKQEEE